MRCAAVDRGGKSGAHPALDGARRDGQCTAVCGEGIAVTVLIDCAAADGRRAAANVDRMDRAAVDRKRAFGVNTVITTIALQSAGLNGHGTLIVNPVVHSGLDCCAVDCQRCAARHIDTVVLAGNRARTCDGNIIARRQIDGVHAVSRLGNVVRTERKRKGLVRGNHELRGQVDIAAERDSAAGADFVDRVDQGLLCSILPDTVQNTCVYKKSFALLYKIIAAVDANAGSSIFNDENFQFLMPVP